MNKEVEILKSLFLHSSENVFILNYEFQILWSNKADADVFFSGISVGELFSKEVKPLKSGEYFIVFDGLEFMCRIINYEERNLYVMQMSGDDVMFSYIKCNVVKEFLTNQAAAVRQAVTGIAFAGNMLQKVFDEENMRDSKKYLDITMGNCYKLLKSVLNTTELIRYTDNTIEYRRINLTTALESFTGICRNILKGQIDVFLKIQPELYIKADPERLTACLLSLTVLVGRHNPGAGYIRFDAERLGDFVSVTVSSDNPEDKTVHKVFSELNRLYGEDSVDSDLFVVKRFCCTFGGTLFVAEGKDNGSKTYSIKFPFCRAGESIAEFSSSVLSYHEDRFSKYHIALSDIAEIY